MHADFPAPFAAEIPVGIFAGNVLAGKSVGKALKNYNQQLNFLRDIFTFSADNFGRKLPEDFKVWKQYLTKVLPKRLNLWKNP